MDEAKITVSVVMITYNHESYIKQAIEGVLMQQCNFNIELIVADDNSPDKTEEIVKQIIKEHPNGRWVKYTKHIINKGANPNFIWAAQQAKGKYIALCEGDDYWTDPLKLQKQVDFLEENERYAMCGTYCDVLRTSGLEKRSNFEFKSFNYYDSIFNNQIPTLTLCFRNYLIEYKNLLGYPIGDIVLMLELTKNGMLGAKLPFNYGVYRYHGNGANSGSSRYKNISRQMFTKHEFSKKNYDKILIKKIKIFFIKTAFNEFKLILKLDFKNFDVRIVFLSIKYFYRTLLL